MGNIAHIINVGNNGLGGTTTNIYNSSAGYLPDNLILFQSVNSDTLDWYLVLSATSPGQNPDNTPASFQQVNGPYVSPNPQ